MKIYENYKESIFSRSSLEGKLKSKKAKVERVKARSIVKLKVTLVRFDISRKVLADISYKSDLFLIELMIP